MKKLFTLIFLFSGILSVSAQIPFPSANAKWVQRHGNGEAPPSFNVIGLKNDDVTIGAYTYHKLYLSTNDSVLDASEYIGGIREAAGGKVYYYSLANSSERLLYDFSLVVGDTIYISGGASPIGVVHSIDVLVIGGVGHKRINFSALNDTARWTAGAWIEGIGNSSLGGLLGSPMLQPTCDCGEKTICFRSKGESAAEYHNPLYLSIDCDDVFSTSGVSATNNLADNVGLFPNPVTGVSHLSVISKAGYDKLTICDMAGKVVKRQEMVGVNDVVINMNDFAPGMYIYKLERAGEASVVGRFTVE